MTKIIMNGCNGHMGQSISKIVSQTDGAEIVAGIDLTGESINDYPVFTDIDRCDIEADVIIDFSSPKAADHLIDYCVRTGTPIVLCTTGLSDEQIARVTEAAAKVAVLRSANMSLGINTLFTILKQAAGVLAPAGYDMEIVEKHHNQKIDAPSGTALALADVLKETAGDDYFYRYDRGQIREKRDPKEIGIAAVRGGTIVGEHDVIFAGEDEVITISHTAYSKAVFGKGALEAAIFLAGKKSGLFNMQDVIAARI